MIGARLARWLFGAGLVFLIAGTALEAVPPKSRPTRPSDASNLSPTVDLIDIARRYGLKPQWIKPGQRLRLSSGTNILEFQADSREISVRGTRVFLGQPVRSSRSGLRVARVDALTMLPPLIKPGSGEKKIPQAKVVVLDPGHGGPDQGTQNSKLKLREKTLTLDVSVRLKKILEADGYKVLLTRSTDKQLKASKRDDLQERAAIANRANADLFISIHFNAVPRDTKTRGAEIFTFTPKGQRSTESWSHGKDDTERETSPVHANDHWNVFLAHAIHRQVLSQLKTPDRGQKMAHFGVLRNLECAGVLVEAGFLSNPAEARLIGSAAYRQKIAEAIADGVRDYSRTLTALRGS